MFKFLKSKKESIIYSPMKGEIVDITEVPDKVFSEKMTGDGVAIKPTDGIVTSPVKGKVQHIFPTNHAIGIISGEGAEILIHIGLNTVELKGEGFEKFVNIGDEIEVGDKLIEVDLELLKKRNLPTITPIIITNTDNYKKIEKKLGVGNKEIMSLMK